MWELEGIAVDYDGHGTERRKWSRYKAETGGVVPVENEGRGTGHATKVCVCGGGEESRYEGTKWGPGQWSRYRLGTGVVVIVQSEDQGSQFTVQIRNRKSRHGAKWRPEELLRRKLGTEEVWSTVRSEYWKVLRKNKEVQQMYTFM